MPLGATFTRFKFSAMANLPCPVVERRIHHRDAGEAIILFMGTMPEQAWWRAAPQVAPAARGVVPLPALHYGFKTEIAADAPAGEARGHQKGRIMKLKLMLAAAVILALPLAAQAQKKPTKADADKVVKLISADKAKTKTYCDLAKLGDEAQQADEKKDTKKAEEIGQEDGRHG